MMTKLWAFIAWVQWWFERKDRLHTYDRAHQLEMLSLVMDKWVEASKHSSEGLVELAKSTQAQAAVFSQMMANLQHIPEPVAPTIAPSLDESEDDFSQIVNETLRGIDPAELSPEWRLAYAEHQKDREREVSNGEREDSSFS
jgi:hypothetical protein